MKRKIILAFFAFTALSMGTAHAQVIPFFSSYPKIDTKRWYISNGWTNGDIQSCEWRADAISVQGQNLLMTLSNKGGQVRPYGCPEIQTNATMKYGRYDTSIKTAAGAGLNTAFFTYVGPPNGVPDHDEIDFEFLGKNTHTVQVNYWVKGKSMDGTTVNLGFDASAAFHNYSFIWEPTKITWYVDGKLVHTSKPGSPMPTNPQRIYLTLWSGSSLENAWLGTFAYTHPVSAEFAWVKYTPLP